MLNQEIIVKLISAKCWQFHPGANGLIFPWAKWSPYCGQHFQMYLYGWKFFILIKISLKFSPKCLIDSKTVLVKVMAWHSIGDKPLMLAQFTDAYIIYLALGGGGGGDKSYIYMLWPKWTGRFNSLVSHMPLINWVSILFEVMACCLTALGHYLNQCWFIIGKDLQHSPDDNFE